MFPRPAKDDARYRAELAEAVYWVMTLSTIVRAGAELWAGWSRTPWLRVLVALGGLGQLLGAALFVINMWARAGYRPPRRSSRARRLRLPGLGLERLVD